ncbi:MAG: hypothetical protein FWG14_11965 [Peptococcaceae bacterium]|nr:hypothetical protein [Peptococcaceae bacterium]
MQMNMGQNQGFTVNPGQPHLDPLVFNAKPGSAPVTLVSIVMLPLSLIALYNVFFVDNATEIRVIAGCIGGAFFLLWVWVLIKYLSVRSAFIAIGPMGINCHLNDDRWIRWEEIGSVGISVLYARPPIRSVGAAIAEEATGGNIVVRIRIAGVVPGLPNRPDLNKWRTHDEPAPYTHKVKLPRLPLEKLENLSCVKQAHAALAYYAGSRYTGVEYRRTYRTRYS